MRALIADDDLVSAAAVASSVAAWGFEVVVAHDGNAAWDCLAAEPPPSLAIVDWEMPGLDGPELCRRLRADASRAHLYLSCAPHAAADRHCRRTRGRAETTWSSVISTGFGRACTSASRVSRCRSALAKGHRTAGEVGQSQALRGSPDMQLLQAHSQ